MSESAFKTYPIEVKQELEKHYKFIVVNTDLINFVGGGSVRCMTAEIFGDCFNGKL